MACDRRCWPRCLAWHGWLPALSPREIHLPWAVPMADGADAAFECALGAYLVHPGSLWDLGWHPEDVNDLAGDVPADPNIWTDGSGDEGLDALVGVAGAGAFVWSVPWVFDGGEWGHAQDLNQDDHAFWYLFYGPWVASNSSKGGVLGVYPCPSSADACSSACRQRKCLQ